MLEGGVVWCALGGGGGFWDPKFSVPKMAQRSLSLKFHFFPLCKVLVRWGEGSRGGGMPKKSLPFDQRPGHEKRGHIQHSLHCPLLITPSTISSTDMFHPVPSHCHRGRGRVAGGHNIS